MSAPAPRPSPSPLRRRLRRVTAAQVAPVAVLLAGLLAALGGLVAKGPEAALGSVLATVATLLFFWTGAIPLLMVGGELTRAGVGYLVLMMTYALRLVALLLGLGLAVRAEVVDARWMAFTLIVCTLVWTGTQVALVGRSRPVL